MIEEGSRMGDYLIVVVNSDVQQLIKKGKIILDQDNRTRLIGALRHVDEVILSIDQDPTQIKTLGLIADKYPDDEIVFGNGGDRNSVEEIPEGKVARERNIKLVFGVGGTEKSDSSTRINQALGHQK